MVLRVQAEPRKRRPAVSYPIKVMLFCLALTMCIIGVSQQMGLMLLH